MLSFLTILLTLAMVLDCIVLVFLVLIQLPKKDAGAGLAFGGGATDALFGAGKGTVLTQITKYAAGAFFLLAVLQSVAVSNIHSRRHMQFLENLNKTESGLGMPPAPAAPAASQPPVPAGDSNAAPVAQPEATNSSNAAPAASPAVAAPPATAPAPNATPASNPLVPPK